MKKICSGLLVILVITSIAGAAFGETRLDSIKAAGKLVVATSLDFAPFEFLDPQGQPAGADMSLAKYIADHLGVELEIREYDFDGVLKAVASGMADLSIAGINPTPERKRTMWFSDPYYDENDQSVLVHKDNEAELSTLEALKGKRVAALDGTIQEGLVKDYMPETNLRLVQNVPDGVTMLLSKQLDGVALPYALAEQYVHECPDLVICAEKISFTSPSIAVALPKDEPELQAAVNEAIGEAVSARLYFNWMNEAVELTNSMID